MQPKRTSFDVKLYMQLHRKVLRKAIIEKKFEQSLYQFSNHIDYGRKGFKGSLKPEPYLQRSNSYREKKIYSEPSPSKHHHNTLYSATHSTLTNSTFNREGEEGRRMTAAAQTSHSKPNMMYNLSLYRKSYKRQDLRNDKICINVMQDLKKTREEASRTSTIRRSKKMLTLT